MADAQDRGNYTTPHARDLNAAARRYLASIGQARSDGSYPIRAANNHGRDDLSDAIHAIGRGNASSATIKAWIIKRARAIGALDLLPATWSVKGSGYARAGRAATKH